MGLVPKDWSGERVQKNTHLLLNVKVKDMWNYTFIPPHAFMVCKRVVLLLQNTNEATQFCVTMLCSQIMVIKHIIYIHFYFYVLSLAWLDDQNQFIQCMGNLWTGLCIVSDHVNGLTKGCPLSPIPLVCVNEEESNGVWVGRSVPSESKCCKSLLFCMLYVW